MKTQHAFLLIVSAQCLFTPVIGLGQGAITLIGPSVRNGSFESGVASPWQQADSVVQDPTFASHGEWFAVLRQGARPFWTNVYVPVRSLVWQSIPVNPSDGSEFLLSFEVRKGSPGFELLWASVWDRSQGVFGASAPIATDGWTRYQFRFQFPLPWTATQIQLTIGLYHTNAPVGMVYTGYLDNVVLQQIPEPGVPALLGLVAGLLFWAVRRRMDRRRAVAPCTRVGLDDPSGV